jgi:hypothetical protein
MTRDLEPAGTIISGLSGTGKTGLFTSLVKRDWELGRGGWLFDLKGEAIEVINYLCATDPEWNDLYRQKAMRGEIIHDSPFATCGRIHGCNVLAQIGKIDSAKVDPVSLLAESLSSHMIHVAAWDAGSVNRFLGVMKGTIGAAMATNGRMTIAELPLLLVPSYNEAGKIKPFNPLLAKCLAETNHLGTLNYWQNVYKNWPPNKWHEWTAAALNQMTLYSYNERVLYATCTVENATLDFDDIIKNRRYVLGNYAPRFLGDGGSLLANLRLTQIYLAALRQNNGHPFPLRIDEAKHMAGSLLDLVAEQGRFVNIPFCVTVQSLSQLGRHSDGGWDWHLRDTLVNNARYVYAFREKDQQDAEAFSKLFFRLSGEIPSSVFYNRALPVPAEVDSYQRAILQLPDRYCYFYDDEQRTPIRKRTPEIPNYPQCSPAERAAKSNWWESQVMGGIPDCAIRAEIKERWEYFDKILHPEKYRTAYQGGKIK